MKLNLFAVAAVVLACSPVFAQHGKVVHHVTAHHSPSHHHHQGPVHHHHHHSTPVSNYRPAYNYQPNYFGFDGYYGNQNYWGNNCNASRSRYYVVNVPVYPQYNFVPMPMPAVQANFNAAVPRRSPAPRVQATPEQLAAISHAAAPKHLTDDQYDRETGKLAWPEALQSSDFAANRALLEQIFAQRTTDTDDDWKTKSDEVRRLTSLLRDQLTGQVKDLKPMEYVAAKKFLDGLSREIRAT